MTENSTTTTTTLKQEKPKKKSLERFSKLFQKKPKKTGLTSSISAMSLSDPALSRVPSQASSNHQLSVTQQTPARMSSLASRRTAPLPPVHMIDAEEASVKSLDIKSNHSAITHTTTTTTDTTTNVVNVQHMLEQQRKILMDLNDQKQQYTNQTQKIQDQIQKTKDKIQQRTHDMELLEANYQHHLKSMRCSDDDCTSITKRLNQLKQEISNLASELVSRADRPNQLATLWLNLGDFISQLGDPLSPQRIQMLTEKFMMDVLVQNLNINLFPGLDCNQAFLDLQAWFDTNNGSNHGNGSDGNDGNENDGDDSDGSANSDSNNKNNNNNDEQQKHKQQQQRRRQRQQHQEQQNNSLFSTQLRQELSMVVAKARSTKSYPDIEQNWTKAVEKSWHHLYRGLQRVYPFLKQENDEHKYSDRLRRLVEDTIWLGIAIKGQEVPITAVDIREGVQTFDPLLMDEEDGKSSGTVAFCISPPFIMKITDRYEPLVKGRVLCTPF